MERWTWSDLAARPVWFPGLALTFGACLGGSTEGSGRLFLMAGATFAAAAALAGTRPGAHLMLLAALVTGGMGLARGERRAEVPAELSLGGGPFHLEGLLEEVTPEPDGASLRLSVTRVEELGAKPVRFRARLYGHEGARRASSLGGAFLEGQRVLALATLKPLVPALNWGESTGSEALARQGIVFTGSADLRTVVPLEAPSPWVRWLRVRREGLGRLSRRLAPAPAAGAFYATLAAGLRAELGPEWEQRFSQSGLAHVLSVSGLHVAALAVFALTLLRWLLVRGRGAAGVRRDARRPAALLALPSLWGYVVFTGNQPPAIRSAVMASVAFGALALWRRADALNSLALAACVLLAWDPSAAGDLSLQLSFVAVLTLILVSPAVRAALPFPVPTPQEPSRWRRWAAQAREAALQAFATSVAVTLGGVPLIAATFHRLSLAGLVSNIVCLPLCGLLTALSAGGAALFIVWPPLAGPCVWLGTRLAHVFLWLVARFAALPGASLGVAALSGLEVSVLALGLAAFALGEGKIRWAGAAVPVALVFLFFPALGPGAPLTVTFLAVGQGDAAVVESRGASALIDGGGVPGGADTGARVVVPYLRQRGIRHLTLAALSHPHPDHALGLISTLQTLRTERLWLPQGNDDGPLTRALREAAVGAQVEEVGVGHPPIALGAAVLRVLGPPEDEVLLRGVNDRSAVFELRHGEVTFLFTGDIEAAAEEVLAAGPTTVLKAPHHGSTTSSTDAFVARTRPRYVVFCVGRQNRFHFPRPEVQARYARSGARCLRTDLHGAVRFSSDGHDVQLETFQTPPAVSQGEALEGAGGHGHVTPDDS